MGRGATADGALLYDPRMSFDDFIQMDDLDKGMVVARGSIVPISVAEGFFDDIYIDYEAVLEKSFQKRMAERGPSPTSLSGRHYVFTGVFRDFKPRKLAMDKLVAKGASVDSGVRNYTTAVFVGDLSRTPRKNVTAKLEIAKEKGIQILGYEDLLWHVADSTGSIR
jgi:NAD-dependent DNA ligase